MNKEPTYQDLKTEIERLKNLNSVLQNHIDDNCGKYKHLCDLFDNSTIGMVICSIDGRFIDVNEHFAKITGYSQKELLEMTFREITHPDDLNTDLEFVNELIENKRKNYKLEKRYITKNSEIVWVNLSVSLVCNQENIPEVFIGTIEDITHRKTIENELIESRFSFKKTSKLLQSVLDGIPDIIGIQDNNHNIIQYNKAGYEFLNKNFEDVKGQKCYSLIGRKEQCEVCSTADCYKSKKPEQHVQFFPEFGVWLDMRSYPILDENGVVMYVIEHLRNITDLKNYEFELQKSKNDWQTIFKAIGHPSIILDKNQKITDVNTSMILVSGKTKDELIGKYCYQEFHFLSKCSPINCPFHKMKKSKQLEVSDMEVEALNGYYLISCTPIYDENNELKNIIHIATDITQRKIAEKKLKEKEEFLTQQNAEFSTLNEELLERNKQIKEINAELEESNEKTEQLLNETQKQKSEIELHNERLESLLRVAQYKPKSNQDLLDYALKEAIYLTSSKIGYIYFYNEITKQFTLNSWSKEVMNECTVLNPQTVYDLDKTGCWGDAVRLRKPIIINNYPKENLNTKGTPEGHVKLNKFLTIPVFSDSNIVAVIGVANKLDNYNKSDINQLVLLMDTVLKISEKEQIIENLISAKEKAEESDRLKTAFLHNISHEIRTPLNAICGFAGFLKDENLEHSKRQNFAEIIINSGFQLTSIINDIISISTIESGQVKTKINETNIENLLNEINSIFSLKAKNKELAFYYKPPITKLKIIKTDEIKLFQIISNLLTNSIKFTNAGYVEFGYNFKTDFIEFYVKDSGIGIKPEFHEKIFERFRQADQSIGTIYGGTGLGLSISKAYTEIIGGNIWLTSEYEKGTTFYFTIPLITNEPNFTNVINTTEKALTIMIAEDDEANYLYFAEIISSLNVHLLHAKDGREAVELCRTNSEINMVFMDIKMPYMNGYEATKQIKSIRPELPIIAQTAYYYSEEKNEAIISGCNDYISKPIKMERVIEIIMKYK